MNPLLSTLFWLAMGGALICFLMRRRDGDDKEAGIDLDRDR
jgi:hypothetical protein